MTSSLLPSVRLLLFLLQLTSFSTQSSIFANQHAKEPPPNRNPQQQSMNPSELETLFNIIETLSSDRNWRVSHPNPCQPGSSWPGIQCKTGNDKLLHVTRLDFGTPPNPTCKNTATFPSQIFELSNLESLFFFHCFTHTKTALSFPQNKVLSTSLQQLSLRSNPAVTGSIPTQISSLKSLQILTLSQNQISGPIPAELSSLSSLVHLDLSYNALVGTIPIQLGNLKNLVGLDLSYNMLTGPIPNTIGQMGMLQKLDISSNLLNGAIPDSIEALDSLVFMALSSNRLHGKLPKGLARLQSLQYFIMDDNPMFVPLPGELGHLQKLQELRLSNSGYSGTIPQTISLLPNLTTLSLPNNRLTGEIPAGFGNLSHIYHLNLSRNFLRGVVPFKTSFLNRLGRNLDLSGNPGLCLSPSEAHGVKVGVDVCGANKTTPAIQPLLKSEARFECSKSFILFSSLGMLALDHVFYFV